MSNVCMLSQFDPSCTYVARVTVVGLCVCLSVCRRLFSHYRHCGAIPTASVLQGHEN